MACSQGSDDADDQASTKATKKTSAQAPTKTTEQASSTTAQPEARPTLKLLYPVSKYKDMEKFASKYNKDDNKYTLDIVPTETDEGIDPMDYDGLVIPGGKHVHPSFYGKEVECSKHGFNEALDQREINLVNQFVDAQKPILGLCRGCQLINVTLGGTLIQDVGMEHYDDSIRLTETTDTVKGLEMRKLFGTSFETAHYHHQAVDLVADGLIVTMVDAEDGTIEGYVHETLPIVAYQFHPDRMYYKESLAPLKDSGRAFMDYFFDICQENKN